MMAVRHMHEFGSTEEQFAKSSVKNFGNAVHNPFAQIRPRGVDRRGDELRDDRVSPAADDDVHDVRRRRGVHPRVGGEGAQALRQSDPRRGCGACGSDTCAWPDRPHGKVRCCRTSAKRTTKSQVSPASTPSEPGRMPRIEAYKHAGITDPRDQISVWELHDAYSSSEMQQYEDVGCANTARAGDSSKTRPRPHIGGKMPVNPSGGLLACGHPVGATG
jgi:acetyl-CoA C-acetyltransferase